MSLRHLSKLAVIGSGQMGAGIAQVAATAGLNVRLIDSSPDQLLKALDSMHASLSRLAVKDKLSDAPDAIMHRVSTSNELEVRERLSTAPPFSGAAPHPSPAQHCAAGSGPGRLRD